MASGRGWGGEGLRFLQEAGRWQFDHTPGGRCMGNKLDLTFFLFFSFGVGDRGGGWGDIVKWGGECHRGHYVNFS